MTGNRMSALRSRGAFVVILGFGEHHTYFPDRGRLEAHLTGVHVCRCVFTPSFGTSLYRRMTY
jgi:hypothetical protein